MEREGRSPLRILRQALRIAEVFIPILFLPENNSASGDRQVFPDGRGASLLPLGSSPEWISPSGLSAFGENASSRLCLRPEIKVEPNLNGGRRGICCKSCQDDPIFRKIRFVRCREGSPADLWGRIEGQTGVQPVLMDVAMHL
jgi:hypothetical protein